MFPSHDPIVILSPNNPLLNKWSLEPLDSFESPHGTLIVCDLHDKAKIFYLRFMKAKIVIPEFKADNVLLSVAGRSKVYAFGQRVNGRYVSTLRERQSEAITKLATMIKFHGLKSQSILNNVKDVVGFKIPNMPVHLVAEFDTFFYAYQASFPCLRDHDTCPNTCPFRVLISTRRPRVRVNWGERIITGEYAVAGWEPVATRDQLIYLYRSRS